MTGPEHYAEAERLLTEAADLPRAVVEVTQRSLSGEEADRLKGLVQEVMGGPVVVAGPNVSMDITPMLRAAQVHATLALAAAQALDTIGGVDAEQARGWRTAVNADA